jgi:parvulin-like peptidyl-prolyl isomerase
MTLLAGGVPSIAGGGAVGVLAAHYSLTVVGREQVAGRDADVVAARRPDAKTGDPDAARFWLDRASGLVLRREVYSKIAIEEQELQAYYQEHLADFKRPSRFRIRELVIPKGATADEQTAAKARLESIQVRLKEGASFEALVKEHSSAPSRATGGDLGWLPKGVLRPSLEEAALALKPEEISAPLETDKDFYLVQLVASELEAVRPFEEVRESLLEKLQEPKAQNAIENYLGNLRTRANIRYLVPREDILKG